MSSFQQTFKALDPSILAIQDTTNTARCAVYVRAEKEKSPATYHKPASGASQRDPQSDENLVFQCASLFKVFIAACVILMVEKLSVDPSSKNPYRKLKGAWNEPFTVVFNKLDNKGDRMRPLPMDPSLLQILVHSNGVYDMNHIFLAPDATPMAGTKDILDRISQYARDSRETQTGGISSTTYSNANYVLLALLIDKASGSLNEFLKEHILTPFEMDHTFLTLKDLHLHSNGGQMQPHVVSSDRSRQVFRQAETLGLADVVDIAWLGPYISAADLGRFFEGLQLALDGKPTGLFDKELVISLSQGKHSIEKETGYTPCGLHTSLNSQGPGSHSLNRRISPGSDLATHIPGKTSDGEDIGVFYLAGCATGWASTVYFISGKKVLVIVLTNTSGPVDASDLIAKLCLQEIFELRPPKVGTWDGSHYLQRPSMANSAERYRAYYVELAARMFHQNSLKVRQLERDDAQMDIPTSACADLLGTYRCRSNDQYLHIIDWKGKDNKDVEGVLRVFFSVGNEVVSENGVCQESVRISRSVQPQLLPS